MLGSPSEVQNATVVLLVSMAKITGSQDARNSQEQVQQVLQGFWGSVYPLVPFPSVDIFCLLTAGQYENTPAEEPYKSRIQKLRQSRKFYAQFSKAIDERARHDPIIVPGAYNLSNWDMLVYDPRFLGAYIKILGSLKSAYESKKEYRELLEQTAFVKGRPYTLAQAAFANEETAMNIGLSLRSIFFDTNHQSLRSDLNGPVFITYPGPMEKMLVWGLRDWVRKNKINLLPGKNFYVDVSDTQKPAFIDLAYAVNHVDTNPAYGPYVLA